MQPFLLTINNSMANFLSGFLNNLSQGLGNPKGTLGDFSHASKLYTSNAYRLAPKVKFLYHVVFNINPAAARMTMFDTQQQGTAINMLVKQVDLPKYNITVDAPIQYNRKKQVHTKLEYDPLTIVFHDDNVGLTTSLWNMYYRYYFSDSVTSNTAYLQNAYASSMSGQRFGLDNDYTDRFFNTIQIFQLERHTYHSFTLINPIIEEWQHDTLNNELSEPVENSMTIKYEAVLYGSGAISEGTPVGFATEYYDHQPSPLTLLGGGTTSLFGEGGVISGSTDILGSILSGQAFSSPGQLFGTIIKGVNVAKNASKLSKPGVVQEGYNILKGALSGISGVNVSGVADIIFPVVNDNSSKDVAVAPTGNTKTKYRDSATIFKTKATQNFNAYANAIVSIGNNANVLGVPTSISEFNSLSATDKIAAIDLVVKEYNNGNPKVISLVNKYIGNT